MGSGTITGDVRVARTLARLRAAIVELVADKGYQAVTVDHIVERAGVTRATFYTHFRDKEHLLASVADDVIDAVLDAFRAAGGDEDDPGGARLRVLFEHARRDEDVFRVILRGEGDGVALRRFAERILIEVRSTMARRIATTGAAPRVPIELSCRSFVGEILATLAWWLDDEGPVLEARTVVDQLRATSLYGRLWSTGLDDTINDPAAAPMRAGLPTTTTKRRRTTR